MDLSHLNIDPSVFNEFIDESTDMLDTIDQQFIKLEKAPNDQDIIGAIFRPIHSIKGNSAFFGLNKIKKLAHELETLLDKVRKNTLQVSGQLIDVILQGTDYLKLCFENVKQQQPEVDDLSAFESLLEHVQSQASQGDISPDAQWEELYQKLEDLINLVDDSNSEVTKNITSIKVIAEKIHPQSTAEKTPLPPAAQAILEIIKSHPDCNISTDEEQSIEKYLEELNEQNKESPAFESVLEMINLFQTFMSTTGFDPLLAELLIEKISEIQKDNGFASEATIAIAEDSNDKSSPPKTAPPTADAVNHPIIEKHESDKTMRVSEGHIDTFLEYVGELLVVGDMFSHLEKSLSSGQFSQTLISNFRRANDTFSDLSNNLQSSIMSIRKIPVKNLLQKVPRIVRDVASKLGKKINVEVQGDDIHIDKSILDMLDSPLTHMVRNAADHGIESPEKRSQTDKDPCGKVQVIVSESDTSIVMTIIDDGGGLDGSAIRDKAVKMGIISAESTLTDQEGQDLIFSSGLSTAKEVTDISGRGVGMDVVRRFIEDAGGTVAVSSILGQGSEFTVQLPKTVTTQIMFGYLVLISGERYVLPMNKVHETARIKKDTIKSIIGTGRYIIRHDNILKIIPLRDLLNLPMNPKSEASDDQIIVTIMNKKKEFAICVDHVLGVQKVVLRKIQGVDSVDGLITGGALMGDGSISLILDTEKIEMLESNSNLKEIGNVPKAIAI